ncbi:glycoside hydrolase family 43 protein [uncultured Mucilaginibacter sp.]|uniref:glycoside hydrolase family 43 protein n=1 Tax=uncultured Mucilaginibacter sp. TaxID=797541 RepID=UPI00262C04CA|nr:glycoside hydrolase family 43 protein [uncultured Mucilaginibacter sp.]
MNKLKYVFFLTFIYGIFQQQVFANSKCFFADRLIKPQTETIYLADPTIFLDKGIYYLYGTSSEQGFLVYQSRDLKKWVGPAGKTNGFALAKGDAYGSKGFWAPQVFKIGNTYYMAYTADEHIAIAQSDSPRGPFKQKEIKALSGVGKQIDPFVFRDNDGKFYLYHVRLTAGNRIFVARMKDDLSDILPETVKECITATQDWENTAKTNWPVTEGPTVIKKGSLCYLIYSANDFRNPDYAVGYATSKSPFGPWEKSNKNPIISKTLLKINGTGHGDLFTDKKGNMHYVFHTHHSNTQVSPRATALVSVKFVKDSSNVFQLVVDPASFRFMQVKKQ